MHTVNWVMSCFHRFTNFTEDQPQGRWPSATATLPLHNLKALFIAVVIVPISGNILISFLNLVG